MEDVTFPQCSSPKSTVEQRLRLQECYKQAVSNLLVYTLLVVYKFVKVSLTNV